MRNEQDRRVKETTRRPTASTNLRAWGLTEPRLLNREHAGPGLDAHSCVAKVQLRLHVGPLKYGAVAV